MSCYSSVVKVAVQALVPQIRTSVVLVVEVVVELGKLCRVLLGIERLRSEGKVFAVEVVGEEVRTALPFYSVVCRASS